MVAAVPTPKKFDPSRYSEDHLQILTDLYDSQSIFIERLPYTEMFDAIVGEFILRTGSLWSAHEVYNLLLVLRKRGRLLPKR